MSHALPPDDPARLAATWERIRPARCRLSLAEALLHPTWRVVLRMASHAGADVAQYRRTVAALKAQAPDEPDLFSESQR